MEEVYAQWGLDDPAPTSPDAAQIVEDAAWRDEGRDVEAFFVSAHEDEAVFRLADRSTEWANAKQAAEAAAKRDGIDTGNPEAVEKYLRAAMAEHDAAIFGDEIGWEYLPNDDWRIRAARRHGDKIVAAFLYREATDAAKAEAAAKKEMDAAFVEESKQREAALIADYEKSKAKKRPGRYAHHGNGAGLEQKEAVNILSKYNKQISVRTLRRWEAGKGTPKDYPGLSSKSQFIMWAALLFGNSQTGKIMEKIMPYRETVTEASNMRHTGRNIPRGVF